MSNQNKLSKFGKIVVAYFSYFSLSGIFALIPLLFIWISGWFKNNIISFLYILTWSALYLISSSNAVKEILKYNIKGSKKLVLYTFLWVVVTFWPCLLYGAGTEDNIAVGMVLMVYILAAYPYLILSFGQLPGLIVLSLFPIFHITIFYVAWKKTYLLYENTNEEFRFE